MKLTESTFVVNVFLTCFFDCFFFQLVILFYQFYLIQINEVKN